MDTKAAWTTFAAVMRTPNEEVARRAFEELYKSVREELVRYATWCAGQHNPDLLPAHVLDATEIAEDAFTELFLQRLAIRKDPHAWVLGTVKRIVRYRVARAWKETRLNREAQREMNRSRRLKPVRSLRERERRQQVREIVRGLPDRMRDVIEALCYRRESASALAKLLNVTPNAIHQMRRRALKRIGRLLRESGFETN